MKEDIMRLTKEISNKELKNLLTDVLKEIEGGKLDE